MSTVNTTICITIPDDHLAAMRAMAAEQDLSLDNTFRQAIRVYQLVHRKQAAGEQLGFVTEYRHHVTAVYSTAEIKDALTPKG